MTSRDIRTRSADLRIDALSEEAIAEIIRRELPNGSSRPGLVVTPNMHHLALLEKTDVLAPAYKRASIVLADGWPVVLLARLLGSPVKQRSTGSGLVEKLALSHGNQLGVIIVGGSSTASNQLSVDKFTQAGWKASGEVAPQSELDNVEGRRNLIRRILEANPTLIVIGVGSPKQETLALEVLDYGFSGWILCAGAGVDFLSGHVQRSPILLRRLGLEWLHRIVQEPQRLFLRYAADIQPFVTVAIRSIKGAD